MTRARNLLLLDALLLLMVVIWAGNYSVVKHVLEEVRPLAFNGLRLTIASLLFGLGWLATVRYPAATGARLGRGPASVFSTAAPITRHDWQVLVALGLIGHCGYQICFITGLARTTVANSALISGCSPIAIALLSAATGHERVSRAHWTGALLSLVGIYLVAGRTATLDRQALIGDLLIFGSVLCWAVFTVFSRPLLARLSPMVVTSASMMIGSIAFLAIAMPDLLRTDWAALSGTAWLVVVGSALLALNLAYLIWYTAVQQIGSARTSIYSNMVPPVAMAIATLVLHERVDALKLLGAAAVVGGVAVTRLTGKPDAGPRDVPPVET